MEDPTEFQSITSQEEFDKRLGDRLAREREKFADYAELKAKAAQLDAAEEAQKTELQKLTDKLAKAEGRANQLEGEMLRLKVAQAKGLTAEQAEFLAGDTEADLEARADKILALAGKTPGPEGDPPATDPVPGNRQEQLGGGIDPTAQTPATSADIRAAVDAALSGRP